MQPLRLVFAGTPDFAARHLARLLRSGHDVAAVYTQPDRPAGRGRKPRQSGVKQLAQLSALPVRQPQSLRGKAQQDEIAALRPDVMVVVAYGMILPAPVLEIPRFGCINVHASLLPRWRGAAPIQRALAAGDTETGISVMQMDAGLDTGDILATRARPIGAAVTAGELQEELAADGAELLVEVLDNLPAFKARARVQDDNAASYAAKISKDEAALDWHRDAAELERLVRAFNPFPVCHTTVAGQRLRVWYARPETGTSGKDPGHITRADDSGIAVQCGRGELVLTSLQLPGGRAMSAAQMLRARRELFRPGTRLGDT